MAHGFLSHPLWNPWFEHYCWSPGLFSAFLLSLLFSGLWWQLLSLQLWRGWEATSCYSILPSLWGGTCPPPSPVAGVEWESGCSHLWLGLEEWLVASQPLFEGIWESTAGNNMTEKCVPDCSSGKDEWWKGRLSGWCRKYLREWRLLQEWLENKVRAWSIVKCNEKIACYCDVIKHWNVNCNSIYLEWLHFKEHLDFNAVCRLINYAINQYLI